MGRARLTILTPTNSLERALVVLEMVSQRPAGFTNAEISRRLHIATSSCSYIMARLERGDYVVRGKESGRYQIGPKVLGLAHGALHRMGFRKAKPTLHNLVSQTRSSTFVAVLERGQIMIVDKIELLEMAKVDAEIGAHIPAHATALGKVLLAFLSDARVNDLIGEYGLAKPSPKTITSKSSLMSELAAVRKLRYAKSEEELFPGVYAVAAPIIDGEGRVFAAVSATGCSARILRDPSIITAVQKASRDISSNAAFFAGRF